MNDTGHDRKNKRNEYYNSPNGNKVIRECNKRYRKTEKYKKTRKKWKQKNKDRLRIQRKKWVKKYNQSEKGKRSHNLSSIKYYNSKKGREYHRKYRVLHSEPFDIKAEHLLNEVIQRDNYTCQWLGCGKKSPDTRIHAHHIFPRSEYPQYKYELWNLICYCKTHHALFHQARGDYYWKLILS